MVLGAEFTEPVNTLVNVQMVMGKYKSTEGDLETHISMVLLTVNQMWIAIIFRKQIVDIIWRLISL